MERSPWANWVRQASVRQHAGGIRRAGGSFAHETVINRAIAHAVSTRSARRSIPDRRATSSITARRAEEEWLPKLASGEMNRAIAMSEPHRLRPAGCAHDREKSGKRLWCSTAPRPSSPTPAREPDHRGSPRRSAKGQGPSLMMVETDDAQGFRRGRKLAKLGLDWAIPPSCLRGREASGRRPARTEEGQGFVQLMRDLPQERLIVCHGRHRHDRAVRWTDHRYVKELKAFGKPIIEFTEHPVRAGRARARRP